MSRRYLKSSGQKSSLLQCICFYTFLFESAKMQVISSGQSIQLANFPDLNIVSKYGEATGSYDFQFLRQSPLFIISNPEKPIEYLTKRTKNEHRKSLSSYLMNQ